jgi:hypothetical protein
VPAKSGIIVYPVNTEVKAGAMLSLDANSRILNEEFSRGSVDLFRVRDHRLGLSPA